MDLELGDLLGFGPYFKQGLRNNRQSENSKNQGVQFDLVLKRKDATLTFIESKFTENPIGMEAIHQFEKKIDTIIIPKKWRIEKVLISAAGVTEEVENADYFQKILGLEAIF